MATRDELDAARLFVEKANRLLNSSFLKEAEGNMGWTLSGNKDEAVKIEHRGPRWESVEAFVLTFRFFLQGSDSISIRQMAKVFSSDLATPSERKRFYEVQENVNAYLDGLSMFKEGSQTMSRREVMDVFIYGGMSHATPGKKAKFDAWMRHQLLAPMTTTEFTTILATVVSAIASIQRICVSLLYRYA